MQVYNKFNKLFVHILHLCKIT